MVIPKINIKLCYNSVGKLLSCFTLFFIFSYGIFAQGENNNWCSGKHFGLSFNTAPPSPFIDSVEIIGASVSDANGNLLFYISDSVVRDRNHNIMPNGHGVLVNGSIMSENMIIVQSPTNVSQYYIVVGGSGGIINKASYSVVDMSLNNGLGDIVAGQKKIIISNGVGSSVVCAKINGGCDGYWIVFHDFLTVDYKAFKLSNASVFTDSVISQGLQMGAEIRLPRMRFNVQGNMLVRSLSTSSSSSHNGTIEIGNFNTSTGSFSNFQLLETSIDGVKRPIFSPDGTRLYCSIETFSSNSEQLFQYNLTLLPNILAVRTSKAILSGNGYWGDARMGTDRKIYHMHYTNALPVLVPPFLSIINNPNAPAASCGYVSNGISVPSYPTNSNNILYEFGGEAYVKTPVDTVHNKYNAIICFNQNLTLKTDTSYETTKWNNGATSDSIIIQQPGIFWVYGRKDCTVYIDTFIVRHPENTDILGKDTSICNGDVLSLNATAPGTTSYIWQDGSTNPTFAVNQNGKYKVTVTRDGCSYSDSIAVGIIIPSLKIVENDTIICMGNQITLHAIANPLSSYVWSNGGTSDSISSNGQGTYEVVATNVCGTLKDGITITERICPCIVFVPNAFTPNGDGINDALELGVSCPGMSNITFVVYNRYGQKVYESNGSLPEWNGTYKGVLSDVGTYFYRLNYKSASGEAITKKGDIILIR